MVIIFEKLSAIFFVALGVFFVFLGSKLFWQVLAIIIGFRLIAYGLSLWTGNSRKVNFTFMSWDNNKNE